jgi:DNA-binding transcriptional ArsR family regulator
MEMNMKNNPLQSIVSLLESISPLARLELLLLIGAGEACVCHLETQLGYRQAYISQHLMALRQAGLLDSRRAGKYIFYRLAKPEVLSLIQQVAQMIGVDLPHIQTVTPDQQCGCPTCTPTADLVSLNHI